ncbi:hypothetical protein TYRP_022290 [Tyrophagus putrescentiae]|nr:hypothetical protein TYRP_022290 [Tyrophagus putrescentiae]
MRCFTTFSASFEVGMPFDFASAMYTFTRRWTLSSSFPEVSSIKCFTTIHLVSIEPDHKLYCHFYFDTRKN